MIHSYMTTGQTWDNNSKKASKCPVCDGAGVVVIQLLSMPPQNQTVSCGGCQGKGWVAV